MSSKLEVFHNEDSIIVKGKLGAAHGTHQFFLNGGEYRHEVTNNDTARATEYYKCTTPQGDGLVTTQNWYCPLLDTDGHVVGIRKYYRKQEATGRITNDKLDRFYKKPIECPVVLKHILPYALFDAFNVADADVKAELARNNIVKVIRSAESIKLVGSVDHSTAVHEYFADGSEKQREHANANKVTQATEYMRFVNPLGRGFVTTQRWDSPILSETGALIGKHKHYRKTEANGHVTNDKNDILFAKNILTPTAEIVRHTLPFALFDAMDAARGQVAGDIAALRAEYKRAQNIADEYGIEI